MVRTEKTNTMYSILLFLLIVILAPVALSAFVRLVTNRAFWILVGVCLLVVAGFYADSAIKQASIHAKEKAAQVAKEQATQKRLEDWTARATVIRYKIGEHAWEVWRHFSTDNEEDAQRKRIAALYDYLANGGNREFAGDYFIDQAEKDLASVEDKYGELIPTPTPTSGTLYVDQ